MRIRTTEPVQGTDGENYPTGTEATLKGESKWTVGLTDGTRARGLDFELESGVILWALVPIQYEEIQS